MALLYKATQHFVCFSPNGICNEEGRIDLSAPNMEGGLDGSLHQQHERNEGFLLSEPGKYSMKISEITSVGGYATAGQT